MSHSRCPSARPRCGVIVSSRTRDVVTPDWTTAMRSSRMRASLVQSRASRIVSLRSQDRAATGQRVAPRRKGRTRQVKS